MVDACHNLRGEVPISQPQCLPLLLEAGDDAARVELRSCLPYLQGLAKLSEVSLVALLPQTPASVAIAGRARLMLVVEMDVPAERERYTNFSASLDKLQTQLTSLPAA